MSQEEFDTLQKRLVKIYIDFFNYRAKNRVRGKALDRISGSVFEKEILKVITENIRTGEGRIVEKCCVVNNEGEVIEFDVGIFRKWKDKEDVPREFKNELPLVEASDVEALIEVKSYADRPGYESFCKALEKCELTEKGYFFGIQGSNRAAKEGKSESSIRPRIFIIAKTIGGNISHRIEMKSERVHYHPRVLDEFLKILDENTCKPN